MVILGDFTSPFTGGKLKVRDCKITAASQVPFAFLKLELNFCQDSGKIQTSSVPVQSIPTYISTRPEHLTISFNGFPISNRYENTDFNVIDSMSTLMPISTEALNYIEKNRKDDVILMVSFNFIYTENRSSPIKSIREYETNGTISFPIKFSSSEWLKILKDLGYKNIISVEIETPNINQPKLKGFNEVTELLDKANTELLNYSNPDHIISDLRSAWDKMDGFVLEFNNEIKNYINSKSKKEDKQPTKDERVESINKSIESYLNSIRLMKESIDKFVQIGPHKEIYHSTREDALLAFRLTVSLMSYYSSILNELNKGGQ